MVDSPAKEAAAAMPESTAISFQIIIADGVTPTSRQMDVKPHHNKGF